MSCTRCELHKSAESICLKGEGGRDVALMIFFDSPNFVEDRREKAFVSDAADLLKKLLQRMSVPLERVWLDYVVKCYSGRDKNFTKKAFRFGYIQSCSFYRFATLQKIRPKEVVGMGSLCCEAFLGSKKVSDYEGTSWTPQEPEVRNIVDRVWITYSPAYAIQDPAESVGIYRTLFAAAAKAGLNPHLDESVKPYDYGT